MNLKVVGERSREYSGKNMDQILRQYDNSRR